MRISFLLAGVLSWTTAKAAVIERRGPQAPTSQIPNSSPFGPLGPLLERLNGVNPDAIAQFLPKAKLAKVDPLKPELRQNAKRALFRYGPYTVVGRGQEHPKSLSNSLDPQGQAFVDVLHEGVCNNCTILRGKTGLIFDDGSEAGPQQGIYLHHILSFDISKKTDLPISKCGVGQNSGNSLLSKLGAEFLAKGDDSGPGHVYFTSRDGKYNSGFHSKPNDKYLNQIDVVNYNSATRNIYIEYDIEYVEGIVGSDAAATLMSVTGCQSMRNQNAHGVHGESSTPPKSSINLDKNGIAVTESPKFSVKRDSSVVGAFGHMHDGGSEMLLFVNGKEVCNSKATYGKGGENNEMTITGMTPCREKIQLKAGDYVSLKAIYDLATHPLREGGEHNAMGMPDVMGMFYMTFAIENA